MENKFFLKINTFFRVYFVIIETEFGNFKDITFKDSSFIKTVFKSCNSFSVLYLSLTTFYYMWYYNLTYKITSY